MLFGDPCLRLQELVLGDVEGEVVVWLAPLLRLREDENARLKKKRAYGGFIRGAGKLFKELFQLVN